MKPLDELTARQSFDSDGYLFIPAFFSDEEMRQIKSKLEHVIKNVVPAMSPADRFFEDADDPTTLKQMQNLSFYEPYFDNLLKESKLADLATVVLGEQVVGKNVEYFNKPAGIGKPTPPHQDGYYFMLNPSVAVTMWLALEDVDHENGYLHYIKGSHRNGMRPHGRTSTLGFSQGITDFGKASDLSNDIPIPARAGDLLLHHSLTIHYAGGNYSASRTRRAMGFIYFGTSAVEDIEAKKAYQKLLADERKSS